MLIIQHPNKYLPYFAFLIKNKTLISDLNEPSTSHVNDPSEKSGSFSTVTSNQTTKF